ncbi:MAG: hypothetical protein Q8O64_14950 [Sideroxyarcus sp.]|nr:hypothetical protein [Sideroxyarcus sp.]
MRGVEGPVRDASESQLGEQVGRVAAVTRVRHGRRRPFETAGVAERLQQTMQAGGRSDARECLRSSSQINFFRGTEACGEKPL